MIIRFQYISKSLHWEVSPRTSVYYDSENFMRYNLGVFWLACLINQYRFLLILVLKIITTAYVRDGITYIGLSSWETDSPGHKAPNDYSHLLSSHYIIFGDDNVNYRFRGGYNTIIFFFLFSDIWWINCQTRFPSLIHIIPRISVDPQWIFLILALIPFDCIIDDRFEDKIQHRLTTTSRLIITIAFSLLIHTIYSTH